MTRSRGRAGRKTTALKRLYREQLGSHEKNVISVRLQLARNYHRMGAMSANELVGKILLDHKLDIDRNVIHKIETQKRGVHDYEIKLFAEVLEVSADWLLGLSNENGPKHLPHQVTL